MDTEKLLTRLRKQFEQDQADERPLRDEAEKDLKFEAGDQWDEKLKADRLAQGRPALTFARCHTFVQQVANEARQNKPQIKYIPAEDGDKDTADVYEGLARHIQYSSEAQEAYETASDYQAAGGWGYFGFITDYCDDDGFDQDLKIRTFHDPSAVYGVLIPACFGIEPDHAFVVDEMPKDAYIAEYGDESLKNFSDADTKQSGWIGTETVRVAEYWYVEKTKREVSNPADPEDKRTVYDKKVKYFKTNGFEILPGTETEWVGRCIPIFPVLGKKKIIKGKAVLTSVIRHQRDAQIMLNMYKTRIAETLTTAPIQPYLVAEGQIEGHQREWAQLNSRLVPFLTYRNVDLNGKPAPVPQRQVFEAPIQALSEAALQEVDDMKATAGIFDPSLGNKSNSVSGIAKARDQQQSSLTNLHFLDNLARAHEKAGKEMAYIIPKIYDAPRQIRILGADEEPKIVKINQEFQQGNQVKAYKIGGDGVAKYDVVVTMGRAFSTKRMESFDMMQGVMQATPQTFPMWADIFFKNSDLAGADQLAERFKKMLPPNLQDEENPEEVIPPQVKATLDQLMQQHQALTEANQALAEEVKNQIAIKQMELESKEKIEMMRLEVQRDIAEITTKAQDSLQRAKLDADLNTKLMVQDSEHAHQASMRAAEIGHETAMADKSHQQAQEAAQADTQPAE